MKIKLFYLFIFVLFLPFAAAYSIGVSPDTLSLTDKEVGLKLFNPNDFNVNYTIEGCSYDFIEIMRRGIIKENSARTIILRYNPSINEEIDSCNLKLYFANNVYATAFSVPVELSYEHHHEKDMITGFFKEPLPHQEKSFFSDYFFIVPVFIAFLIILFLIIKFF